MKPDAMSFHPRRLAAMVPPRSTASLLVLAMLPSVAAHAAALPGLRMSTSLGEAPTREPAKPSAGKDAAAPAADNADRVDNTDSKPSDSNTAAGRNASDKNGSAAKGPEKVRVPYLSPVQRRTIKDELRDEVIETARRENWTKPDAIPGWVRRMQFDGDLTLRYELGFYGNENNGQFFNFQELNRNGPFNVAIPPSGQPITLPFLNTTEDRRLMRMRVRFGFGVALSDDMRFTTRLSTGNSVNPASNTNTLGTDFGRAGVVFDRAFLRYTPLPWLGIDTGRGPNPYSTGTDLIWDRDLGFDGISARIRYAFSDQRSIRLSTGFHAIENTDPNFPSTSLLKVQSRDKWLVGGQLDFRSDVLTTHRARVDVGYYHFINAEGKLSSPCLAPNQFAACDTDNSRPGFVQKGNTMFALRDLQLVNPDDAQFQFFGLASPFSVLSVSTSYDMPLASGVRLAIDAEAARNMALDRSQIRSRTPVNNLGPCVGDVTSCVQAWEGGGDAWQAQVRVGNPVLQNRNDWQMTLGYRYVETDAVIDAFTDSEFHQGGTNDRGYYVGAAWSFNRAANLSARYFGATEITGPKLTIDLLQIDLSARF